MQRDQALRISKGRSTRYMASFDEIDSGEAIHSLSTHFRDEAQEEAQVVIR